MGAVSVVSALTRLLGSYHFTAALVELLDRLVKLFDRKRHIAWRFYSSNMSVQRLFLEISSGLSSLQRWPSVEVAGGARWKLR